jgi:hypothetical protein
VACADSDADSGDLTADAPSSRAASTSATQAALPDGILALPEAEGADEDAIIAEPGRYRVPLSDTLALEVDLPKDTGLSYYEEGVYLGFDTMVLKTEVAGESYGVPADPCHSFNDVRPAGSSVEDLVTAIRKEPVYRVSRPEPVEIDGAAGQYLELRIPAKVDASTCTESQLGLPGNLGSNNNMEPGYVGLWWILDVEGERTVIQAFCGKCDAPTAERITRTVRQITFTSTS